MDFNEIDLINRFSLAYRWGKRNKTKTDLAKETQTVLNIEKLSQAQMKGNKTDLAKEAQTALNIEQISQKEAEKLFDEAKDFYNKKQYLYSTDILQKIIIKYPAYDSPTFYYNKIKKLMMEHSKSKYDSSFADYAYWSGYKNYYEGNYDQCLKEWKKYLQFNNKNTEIKQYYDKVNKIITDSIEEKNKKEFEFEADAMLKSGITLYKNKQWIKCIKQMEKLQVFIKNSKYVNLSFNYYSLAKDYIDKSVKELSKLLVENKDKEQAEEKQEGATDKELADSKYNEGLILYAKGKYFEAEKMFELTLRLDPNHKKAINALKRIKE
jgi:tetratricopeptide (TPR) repeat protein